MNLVRIVKALYVMLLTALVTLFAVALAPASQAAAATGNIDLYVNHGPVGTSNAVIGSGFTPRDNYTVMFATTIVSTGTIGISGEFAVDFIVPAYPRGQYAVTVTTASDTSNTEYFTVTPQATLDATSGRPCSQVRVTGSGFNASSSVTILFDSTILGSVMTNAGGTFANATFSIPASSPGKHTVTGKDSVGPSPEVTFSTTQPEISLSQRSGRVGDQISVSGVGFKPSSSVSILFDSTIIGNVMTDASGAFSKTVVSVPHSSQGEHTITGKDGIGPSPEVTFNILQPEITLSQGSGRVDDQISVSGIGFKPSSSVSILFDVTSIGNAMTSASGAFSNAVVTIPPGSGGKHVITAKDAINVSVGVNLEITQGMTISPLSGAVGELVKVSGSGFGKKSTIVVEFDTIPVKINAVTDASGSFASSFEVPGAAAGKHTVHIRDSGGNEKTVTFTVIPKLTVSPETGPPGTMAKAAGTGFAANKPVVIKYNGVPVAMSPASIGTDSQGGFFATFEVPPSLPGIYSVEASEASYTASAKFTSFLAATISQITSKAAPGHVGMQLSVNGVGFRPNAKITVTRATIQKPLATADTNAQGVFSINFTIPPSPSGEHHIIVTDGVNTKEFQFFIEQEPPSSPVLLQPEAGQKAKQPIFFAWKGVSDPSGVTYTIQIARDKRFESVFLEKGGIEGSEFTATENELEPVTRDNPYYWRVKAADGAYNESEWSDIRSFSTGFVLTLPNGESELLLSALWVYGIFALIVVIGFLSFVVGRKSASF